MSETLWIDQSEVTREEFDQRTKTPRGKSGYFIDGVQVPKDVYFKRLAKRSKEFSPAYVEGSYQTPVECDASAIHPAAISQYEKFDRQHGCVVEYNKKDGRPKFTSRELRKRYLKAHRLVDRSSFYGY